MSKREERHDARPPAPRWVEITPSQFPHEAQGLRGIRALFPDRSPFRAWTNFEFRDHHGKWHEVDLLFLGRRRLHLVELKYYAGVIDGDDQRWLREGRRAEDSPLKLARRKAQRLASKLQDEYLRWATESNRSPGDPRTVIPFVHECVFLHHPETRCTLAPAARIDVFGLDRQEGSTGLPGISTRLFEPAVPGQAINSDRDEILAVLLKRIGVYQRRQREVGSWIIDGEPVAEGEGWQDWPAFHRVAATDRARIHFLITPPGSSRELPQRLRRIAEHEYRILTRLAHDGVLRPRDVVQDELGVGLVYPEDKRFQRLDLWMAEQTSGISVRDQVNILRQVAEAVAYAHANRVVHRGLAPSAVWVRQASGEDPRVRVGGWETSGALSGDSVSHDGTASGITQLMDADDDSAGDMHRAVGAARGVDVDRRLAEAYEAPEELWSSNVDRIRLDVFALGAVAYFLFTGNPPASDRAALRERLTRDRGLDLAAELPQVASAARHLVLEATRPGVSDRLPDVRAFLDGLALIEGKLGASLDEDIDPLEANPGTALAGRFELIRRLGAGSSAVGFLVNDRGASSEGAEAIRVLKVAVDDAASVRLAAEAETLKSLGTSPSPGIVRLLEGPIEVGGRRALLLENAGEQTLGQVLRERNRVSIDLLERWGSELLDMLVRLDQAGVDHRDIKPANLGVRERRGDHSKHLVLFDFSLSRAGASSLTAGTPPYLDPFLGSPQRPRYDSAAERYSAAVVLFEMASGATPVYGDGLSDPASVGSQATIEPAMFDPSVATPMTAFFRSALARDATARYDTAMVMRSAWQKLFSPLPKTVPDDADERASAAQPSTPLTEAGLSVRALSALEPYGVSTVADLVAIDPVRLNRLAGVAEATRKEVKGRAREWRDRLGLLVTGRGRQPVATSDRGGALPDPVAAAEMLVERLQVKRAEGHRQLARLLLGLDAGLDAFATQAEMGAALGVTRGRAAQHLASLQDSWAADEQCCRLLDSLSDAARESLTNLNGVATVEELADTVLIALATPAEERAVEQAQRIATGLLRLALDRAHALDRADAGADPLSTRRHGGRVALLATDASLLDAAEALTRAADELVREAQASVDPIVPARRTAARLRDTLSRATHESMADPSLIDDSRLGRLAAALSPTARVSGAGELHHRDLASVDALRLALQGVGGFEPVKAQEIRDRVRARFPAIPRLPERPALDELVYTAGLGLVYDDGGQAYRSQTRPGDTSGLESRRSTQVAPAPITLVAGGPNGHRLAESVSSRSFLALGVDASRVDRAVDVLKHRYGAETVDLTATLLSALRSAAEEAGVPWATVLHADAAAPGTRDAAGLRALLGTALSAIDSAISEATTRATRGTSVVLLTEAGPLARYDELSRLAHWTDLTTPRGQAIWLLVPQLGGSQGPLVDGRPLPLAAPGQFLRMDAEWIDAQAHAGRAVEGALP
jgi:serine/threonine protein kinase